MFTIKTFPAVEEVNEITDERLPYSESMTKEMQTDLHFFNEAFDFSEKAKGKKGGEKDGFVDAHKQQIKKKQVKKFNTRYNFKKTTKKVVKRTFKKK